MKQERSKKDFLNDKKSKQQKKKLKSLLPLPADVIKTLRQKHPDPKPSNDTMLHGPSNHVNEIIFDVVNADLVTRTKGSHGPSGLDAVLWSKILRNLTFGNASDDLCHANVIGANVML